MIRIWVDFNEVYDDDFVWTSLRRGTPEIGSWELEPDELVDLVDDDGASCWGVVIERTGPILITRLLWNTWTENNFTPRTNFAFASGEAVFSDAGVED